VNPIATRQIAIPIDTKERILDVAEDIFAQKGFSATSMRNITAQADVNLAAINYHFGSKAQLYQEVFRRRVGPINKKRIQLLDKLETAADGHPLELESILRTFITPALQAGIDPKKGGNPFIRLLGRTHAEPGPEAHDFLPELYEEVKARYRNALARTLPHLSEEELSWRVHFVIGTIAFTLAGTDALHLIESCRYCDPADIEGVTQRLIPFLVGGLNAQSTTPPLSPTKTQERYTT